MPNVITDIAQLDLNGTYTYADYLSWKFAERVELIKGRIFKMAPAPSAKHQRVSGEIFYHVKGFLHKKTCQVFSAPFDVRLPLPPNQQTSERSATVVQPDICVVCNPELIDERGCQGAPDWVIEILSPSTAEKDLKDKFELYQHAKVKEYWVVFPYEETVIAYVLNEEGFYQSTRPQPFINTESIPVHSLPGLDIDLAEVFAPPPSANPQV